MNHYEIKLSAPDVHESDIQAVNEVLSSGWLSLGPNVEKFEKAFASYLGVEHAVACNSGTSALHMIMRAAGIGPGDEVITSCFSFVASANCIEMVGAKPVFIDIDPISLNMDPRKIQAVLNENTKAILAVHIFGLSAQNADMCSMLEGLELPIFEDACEALGAEAYGQRVGNGDYAQAAAWGFYPNKQMTTGEGGMVTTNDSQFASLCRQMRNQGRSLDSQWLEHDILGYNYRMSDINAALGYSQIRRIDEILHAREEVALHYNARLRPLKDFLILPMELAGFKRSWFVYPLVVRKGWDRDKLCDQLAERGIQTGKYFCPPIHLQKYYRDKYGYKPGDFPLAEGIGNQIITLPFHTRLEAESVEKVCDSIEELFRKKPDLIRSDEKE